MKRWMGLVVSLGLAAVALSQAPFTIVRPADGSKVREVVRILLPKDALGEDDFVGVYVDDKFVEATILEKKGDFREYTLDTKGSKITDGLHKVMLVKYSGGSDRPHIEDRTSVNVTVANSASIKVPEDGFLLRYKWQRGKQLIYNSEVKASMSAISEAQARSGGKAAELPLDTDYFRYLYSVDNAYGNGDGLLRLQALPNKGKNYLFFRLLQSSTGEIEQGVKHPESDMYPAYMRVSDTGAEQFGNIPLYFGLMGSSSPATEAWVLLLPMPALPTKAQKPGDSFPARFQLPELDDATMFEAKNLVKNVQARGEFVGAEWEAGHPCAKLRYTVTAQLRAPKAGSESKEGLGGDKISLEQTVYFAMDLGVPVKIILDETIDTKGTVSSGGAPAGGAGPAGGGKVGAGAPPGMGLPPGFGDDGMITKGSSEIKLGQKGAGGGLPPMSGGPQGGVMPPGMPGGVGAGQGRQGAPSGGAAQNEFLRLRIRIIQTLEQ